MILYACNVCGKVEPEINGTTVIIKNGCLENHFMLCKSCIKALKLDLGDCDDCYYREEE